MKSKIELKLSSAQYKEMLKRVMERQSTQTSVLNQMPDLTGGMQSLGGALPPQMEQAAAPMMPPNEMSGVAPMPGVMGNVLTTAQDTWQEIKSGVGAKLWQRIYSVLPKQGTQSPEDSFVQEYTKYLQDPKQVSDERVKNFFDTLKGTSSVQLPTTPDQDPMMQMIQQGIGGMPNG